MQPQPKIQETVEAICVKCHKKELRTGEVARKLQSYPDWRSTFVCLSCWKKANSLDDKPTKPLFPSSPAELSATPAPQTKRGETEEEKWQRINGEKHADIAWSQALNLAVEVLNKDVNPLHDPKDTAEKLTAWRTFFFHEAMKPRPTNEQPE